MWVCMILLIINLFVIFKNIILTYYFDKIFYIIN